jgi:hypothetical protein
MTKYIKVQVGFNGKAERGPSYTDPIEKISLEDLFDGSNHGSQYILTQVEMTDEEHAALPEFAGF